MMKSLCLVLLLGLSMPGCSMFDKNARQERAYHKYVKKMKTARERQRSLFPHEMRAERPYPVRIDVVTTPVAVTCTLPIRAIRCTPLPG